MWGGPGLGVAEPALVNREDAGDPVDVPDAQVQRFAENRPRSAVLSCFCCFFTSTSRRGGYSPREVSQEILGRRTTREQIQQLITSLQQLRTAEWRRLFMPHVGR